MRTPSVSAFARTVRVVLGGLVVLAIVAPPPAAAQDESPTRKWNLPYVPYEGQDGKDVVWVPTPETLVEKMLDIAGARPGETLVDLGSGDGRTVIAAARRGLDARGIEYNPDLVDYARKRATAAGVGDRARFENADIFESDFSDAQVITLFLLPSLNERLRPEILKLKPGTRIVSNTFGMGDWPVDDMAEVGDGCSAWCTALLWVVPASVEGEWRVGDRVLKLDQRFQLVEGALGDQPISLGRVWGEDVTFVVDGVHYTGTVNGRTIEGKTSKGGAWTATRS